MVQQEAVSQALEAQAVLPLECDVPLGWSLTTTARCGDSRARSYESLDQRGDACYHEHRAVARSS